ncbi:Trihelix transcription factor ASIL2, partial [Linum grandiflorum]
APNHCSRLLLDFFVSFIDEFTSDQSASCSGLENEKDEEGEGVRRLARAIERFGDVYERVESETLRQMIDLENQRKFAKDLEIERMRIFTKIQIQLERIKKVKRSNGERDY